MILSRSCWLSDTPYPYFVFSRSDLSKKKKNGERNPGSFGWTLSFGIPQFHRHYSVFSTQLSIRVVSHSLRPTCLLIFSPFDRWLFISVFLPSWLHERETFLHQLFPFIFLWIFSANFLHRFKARVSINLNSNQSIHLLG